MTAGRPRQRSAWRCRTDGNGVALAEHAKGTDNCWYVIDNSAGRPRPSPWTLVLPPRQHDHGPIVAGTWYGECRRMCDVQRCGAFLPRSQRYRVAVTELLPVDLGELSCAEWPPLPAVFTRVAEVPPSTGRGQSRVLRPSAGPGGRPSRCSPALNPCRGWCDTYGHGRSPNRMTLPGPSRRSDAEATASEPDVPARPKPSVDGSGPSSPRRRLVGVGYGHSCSSGTSWCVHHRTSLGHRWRPLGDLSVAPTTSPGGHLGGVYSPGNGIVAFPGMAVLLAPVAMVTGHLQHDRVLRPVLSSPTHRRTGPHAGRAPAGLHGHLRRRRVGRTVEVSATAPDLPVCAQPPWWRGRWWRSGGTPRTSWP